MVEMTTGQPGLFKTPSIIEPTKGLTVMRNSEKRNLVLLAMAVPFFLPYSASAAENMLNGGVALGQAYDSNFDRAPSDEESEWKSMVTPSLIYTRSEQTSKLSVKYAPSITYNDRTNDKYMDQFAAAGYDLLLSQRFQLHFADTYIKTDDPYSDSAAGVETSQGAGGPGSPGRPDTIEMSDQRGENRYWTNNFSTSAGYEYARESSVNIGYQYHILDNENETIADYVKHSPHISIMHQINQQWETLASYRFIKGDFDDTTSWAGSPFPGNNSEDLTTNAGDLYLYYNLTQFSNVFGHYGYSQTDYDGIQEDYDSHTLSAGATHQFSPSLSLGGEAGASLLQQESDDTNAFYLRLTLNKAWEKSAWALSADSGLDEQQFSGVDNEGLTRYWMIKNTFTHTFTKDINGMASLSYRDDTYLERITDEKEQQLQGNALLSYSFAQWYQLSLRYTYVNQMADFAINEYEDHRILLQLSAAKDLLKW
jgi:hypothetical protein